MTLVPARMVNEFSYCPRLCYLEWVQGEFVDNADTTDGRFAHRRVDHEDTDRGQVIHERSVMLSCSEQRLIARIDLLTVTDDISVPVEYKRGKVPDIQGGVWESDQVQLCVQALILRSHGYQCDYGFVYYTASKQKVKVDFVQDLVERTYKLRDDLLTMAEQGIPAPLTDSTKCVRCSLNVICLPDEVNMISDHGQSVRQLVPARANSLPMYVQTQGSRIGKKGLELVVKEGTEVVSKMRVIDVSQLCVLGNVQVSTQVIRELCSRDIPICYFSTGHWFSGMTTGMGHKNVELRVRQYAVASCREKSLEAGKRFVSGKIKNARTMLRRNDVDATTVAELHRLANNAMHSKDMQVLLGIEGAAARVYFSKFDQMLKHRTWPFDFKTRNRRPPTDPVNALLSFVYALLVKDLTVTAMAVGLDPYLGFYHQPRYGRPALALDLAEEFRVLIGDSVVLSLINSGQIKESDFVIRQGSVGITSSGRKKVLGCYERRMDQLIVHPVFGYRISYRRICEVQARLLSRWLSEEIDYYPVFTNR